MYTTSIARASADRIDCYGLNLTEDIVGVLNLGDMAFLGATGTPPTENESRMFNAVLVGLAEHGFTPSSLATRLTVIGAPEATQAAIAAGLLGAGSVFLGVMDGTARILGDGVTQIRSGVSMRTVAGDIVDRAESDQILVPGFGHPTHKPTDPRTERFFALAAELGFNGIHVELMQDIGKVLEAKRGGPVTLNGAGAAGAVLADMGLDWRIVRACIVAARAVGLIGHVAEELKTGWKGSVAGRLTQAANSEIDYRPSRGGAESGPPA